MEPRTQGKGLPLRGAEATLKVMVRRKKESVGTSAKQVGEFGFGMMRERCYECIYFLGIVAVNDL